MRPDTLRSDRSRRKCGSTPSGRRSLRNRSELNKLTSMTKLWALLLLLASSGAALAQDGGKLNWRGKSEDPKAALAEARTQGRPTLLFFTSKGCKYCHLISEGAFSDSEVV